MKRSILIISTTALLAFSTSIFATGIQINMAGYVIASASTNPGSGIGSLNGQFILHNRSGVMEPTAGTMSFKIAAVGPKGPDAHGHYTPAKSAQANGLAWNAGSIPQVAFNWQKGIAQGVTKIRLTVTNHTTGLNSTKTCTSGPSSCAINFSLTDWTKDLNISVAELH